MKKVLSLLLAMVLVVGLLPMGAFAEGEDTPVTERSQATTQPPAATGANKETPSAEKDVEAPAGSNVIPADGKKEGENSSDVKKGEEASKNTEVDKEENREEEEKQNPKARGAARNTGGEEGGGDKNGSNSVKTPIDLSGATNLTKVYDGTNTIDIPSSASSSIAQGDSITLTATLDSADAGARSITAVTISGNDANKYTVSGYENLTVNITKATCKTVAGGVTRTVTAYKNVPDQTVEFLVSEWVQDFKQDPNHQMIIESYGPQDSSDISSILKVDTGTATTSGNTVTLKLNEKFNAFAKSSVTFKFTFKNYTDAEVTVNFEAEELTYIVAYDLNGGEGTQPVSVGVSSYAQEVTLDAGTGLTRTKYTFKGWNTKADGTGTQYAAGATVSRLTKTSGANVILYAQWKPTEEQKPDVKEGDIITMLGENGIKATYIKYDSDTKKEYSLSDMTGYTYEISGNDVDGYQLTITMTEAAWKSKETDVANSKGFADSGGIWKLYPTDDKPYAQTVVFDYTIPTTEEDDKGGETATSPFTYASGSLTIYMNQYFTVTYQMKSTDNALIGMYGKSVQCSVAKGEKVPEFKASEEVYTTGVTGYTFLGWVLEGSADIVEKPWENQTVTQNLTYTGQWKQHKFTITFDKGATDATGTMESMRVTYGDGASQKLPASTFQRSGYVFKNWRLKDTDRYYEDGAFASTICDQDDGTVTLVAQWEKAVDHVDFSLSGYDIGKAANQSKVTTQTKHVNYGGAYGTDFWISTREDGSKPLAADQFAVDTTYYLFVSFTLEEGYADGGLTTKTVQLDGRDATTLTPPKEEGVKYTAVFQLPTIRKITVEVGKNGSMDPGKDFYAKDGDEITFKVTPNSGYVCSAFKVDGKTQSSHTLTVSKSHTVKVQFAKESKRDTSNPKTGDGIFLPTTAMLLSAMAICAIVPRRKRR